MRTRVILVSVGFVVAALLWFVLLWKPTQDKIDTLLDQQAQARQEQQTLRAQIARLRDLQQQEPRLRAELVRLQDSLPTDPRLPDFILQIQESASLAGIDFLTLAPSVPAPFTPPGGAAGAAPPPAPATAGQLQSISVSVTATGKYFEVLDFIVRLERLRRAMRVNNISMAPGGPAEGAGGGSPTLSVSFALQMFLVSQAPVAPGATATPAGAPSPTPAATPPAGVATPVPAATPAPGG